MAKMDETLAVFDTLKVSQENICDKFVNFGHTIEQNAYRLDKLEELTQDLVKNKANEEEF